MKVEVIMASPPTPNGPLHLGHMSGPYLSADILARYLRFKGRRVVFITGLDSNQNYVVSKANELGIAADSANKKFSNEILECFDIFNISLDAIYNQSSKKEEFVEKFFSQLYKQNKIKIINTKEFYSPQENKFLYDSYIKGNCPNCLAITKGNICENCSFPNLPSYNLLRPEATLSNENLSKKTAKNIFFPLNLYKGFLKKFTSNKLLNTRPKLKKYFEEILNSRLPNIQVARYSDWGQEVDFIKLDRKICYNPWLEILPSFIQTAANKIGIMPEEYIIDSEINSHLFFGFDNAFFLTICHLALLRAYDENANLTKNFYSNEFLLLGGNKFSSSSNNAIWALNSAKEYSSDILRFSLASNSPEFRQQNFDLSLAKKTEENLVNKITFIFKELSEINFQKQQTSSEFFSYSVNRYKSRFDQKFSPTYYSLFEITKIIDEFLNFMLQNLKSNQLVFKKDAELLIKCMIYLLLPIMPKLTTYLAEKTLSIKISEITDESLSLIKLQTMDIEFEKIINCLKP